MKITASVVAAAAACAMVAGCSQSEKGADFTAQAKEAAEAAKFSPSEGKAKELHIYTWSDYISPSVIESFQTALNCKVVIDTFDSNEAMYAKLKAGGTGYDIIMPSSYQIATMVSENMIDKIDQTRIPTVHKNFDRRFEKQIIDPSFSYNVPYAVTYTGFAYRKDKLPEGVDVSTWAILGNEAFKGRITLLDDLREVIGAGLMFKGYSVNSTDPKEIDEAVKQVLEWKKNVRKFDAESYKTEVASGATFIGHGYSTDTNQLIIGDEEEDVEPREDVGFALPKEGFTIAFDEMVIASDAKEKDLAYAFINYIYMPEVAAENMNYICGPNPVAPAFELLDADYCGRIVLPEDVLMKGQVLRGFQDKPEVMDLYTKAWDKIRAVD